MKLLQKYLSNASIDQFNSFLKNMIEYNEDYSEKNLIDILKGKLTFASTIDYPHLIHNISKKYEWTGIHYIDEFDGVKRYFSEAQEISKKLK